MRFDTLVASESGSYAIFDPAAEIQVDRASLRGWQIRAEALAAEAARGNVLVNHDADDGSHRVRIYVDEDAESRLARLATRKLENSILRVPSGRICLVTAELWPPPLPGEKQSIRPDEILQIPSGVYRLRAFHVGGDLDANIARDMGLPAATDWRRLEYQTGCGCLWTTAVLVLSIVGAILPRRWAWRHWWAMVITAAVALVPVWAYVILQWRAPRAKEASARRDAAAREWPTLVIELKTLDGPIPDKFAPADIKLLAETPAS